MEISEDDWKVVEARLQQDIDNGKGDEVAFMYIGDSSLNTGSTSGGRK